jgi:hypothetical protein
MESSSILLDIFRGYSIFNFLDKKIYFKHLTTVDFLKLEEKQRLYEEEAKRSGIKSEKELLDSAIDLGFWSELEQKKMEDLKWQVEKSEEATNKISDENQKKLFRKSFEKEKNEFIEIWQKKQKITNYSAEKHAQIKKTKGYYDVCFFKDKKLKNNYTYEEISSIPSEVFDRMSLFSDEKKMVYAAYDSLFFDIFVVQSSNPLRIFEKKINNITLYQSRLISLANILLNKIKNSTKEIPKEVISDAYLLYNYKEKTSDEESRGKVTHGVDDLKEKMRKKGKVTSEDFLS